MDIILYTLIGVVILLFIAGLAIANFSDGQLLTQYNLLLNEIASINLTALDFCRLVSNNMFGGRITVGIDNKVFGGVYYPGRNHINISKDIAFSGSVSALTICAHELGHAMQFRDNREKILKHYKFSRIIKFLGFLVFPLFISSIMFIVFDNFFLGIILAGVALIIFILALGLKIFTVNIEKEASMNALKILKEFDVLHEEHTKMATSLLNYAKQTYVADFFRALLCWTFLTRKTKIFS